MKYLSLCSGIEAATVAWHPLGWEAVAYSEIERFPSELLAHHYPNTPNLGDMTKFKEWTNVSNVDLLVGGTPCQSFSVAGLRKGLDDPRGNLMLTYLAIAKQYRPNWLVWENVPGVLSSNGGRDFGSFLGGLAECGYGFAYRVLDAQFFGVAQRRRRVFVVGYLGDWRAAAAVLFERHSLQGHPAPSREKRQSVAASVESGVDGGGLQRTVGALCADSHPGAYTGQDAYTGRLIPSPVFSLQGAGYTSQNSQGSGWNEEVSFTLNRLDVHGVAQPIAYAFDSLASNSMKSANPASGCNEVDVSKALDTSRGLDPSCNQGGIGVAQPIGFESSRRDGVRLYGDVSNTLQAFAGTGGGNSPMVAQPIAFSGCDDGMDTQINVTPTMRVAGNSQGNLAVAFTTEQTPKFNQDQALTLTKQSPTGGGQPQCVMQSMAVRRLTPVECERLQGFGDNYTDIKSKGKPTPDGPRYKALGNSMAVPVMAWIGQRIEQVEAICKQNR